jgi:hypothetical protein
MSTPRVPRARHSFTRGRRINHHANEGLDDLRALRWRARVRLGGHGAMAMIAARLSRDTERRDSATAIAYSGRHALLIVVFGFRQRIIPRGEG